MLEQWAAAGTNVTPENYTFLGLEPPVSGLQSGGVLDPTKPTLVGEAGPEMIVGNEVIPNEQLPMALSMLRNQEIQAAQEGGQFTVPGDDAFEGMMKYLMPGVAGAYQTGLAAPRFDLTETFSSARDVFDQDLQGVMAQAKEEMSGFGLNPGASDRTRHLIRAGSDAASRFNLGQQGLAAQAFENAEQRRLGALNQLPAIQNFGNFAHQRKMDALPFMLQREQQPFQNMLNIMEPAAQRSTAALGLMPNFYGLPFDMSERMFRMGEQARGVADTDIARMMNEFTRTQGGQFNQLMSLLSGVPLNQTGVGPSYASQTAGLLGSILGLIPGLGG
jgi:hypothetical protein